ITQEATHFDYELQCLLQVIFEGILEILLQYYPIYENMIINQQEESGIEEDVEGGPQRFISAICEFSVAFARSPRTLFLLPIYIPFLFERLVPFFQITEMQRILWSIDLNSFIAQQEEAVPAESVRLDGKSVMETFLGEFPEETIIAVIKVANIMLERALEKQECGSPFYWKLQEVALWLVGLIGPSLTDISSISMKSIIVEMARVLLQEECPDFLRACGLWAASRMQVYMKANYPEEVNSILTISAHALSSDKTALVRISACKSFENFLGICTNKEFRKSVVLSRGVLESLLNFLTSFSEDALRLTLDVLTSIVRHCPDAILEQESRIVPLVLTVWGHSCNDPLVNTFFQQFLHTACHSSQLLRTNLEERLIPHIIEAFTQYKLGLEKGGRNDIESNTISVCMDAYTVLVDCQPDQQPYSLSELLWKAFDPFVEVHMNYRK
ncbi:putative Importin-9, partial [Cardiosporidium cionae]